jgi:hypothetical protein
MYAKTYAKINILKECTFNTMGNYGEMLSIYRTKKENEDKYFKGE